MNCENCKQETEFGEQYRCYFGHTVSEESRRINPTQVATTTHYWISGRSDVFLCDVCVLKKVLEKQSEEFFFSCLGTVLFGSAVAAVAYFFLGWGWWVYATGLGGVLLLGSTFSAGEWRKLTTLRALRAPGRQSELRRVLASGAHNAASAGDRLAIELRKDTFPSGNREDRMLEQKKKEVDKFFTRKQYQAMQKERPF